MSCIDLDLMQQELSVVTMLIHCYSKKDHKKKLLNALRIGFIGSKIRLLSPSDNLRFAVLLMIVGKYINSNRARRNGKFFK